MTGKNAMVERILYGVQGEGRGHAARSLQIIQWLMARGYRVKVMTGGDALKVLGGLGLDLEEVPMFRYHFRADGAFSPWRTAWRNAARGLGLLFGIGRQHDRVSKVAARFRPGLIISDFEPYLSRIAARMGVPLIAIDHQHFLTESVLPPLSGWQNALMLKLYQLGTALMAGKPDGIITSSFYHFPKKRDSRAVFVGPFIPSRLKSLRSGSDGSITVYLKQAIYLQPLLAAMASRPNRRFVVFSDWNAGQPRGLPDNVRTAPISRDGFLAQLAKGSALITTAGNQVIGEAVYLRKPVLAFPEPDVLEQELNALALQRSGYGESFQLGSFTPERWDAFEARMARLAAGMGGAFRNRRAFDGRRQALRTLHRFIRSIASEADPRRKSRISFAR
jgi:uncharacterized protein (TIGR00661 family)